MKYIRITRRIFGMLALRWREGALMVLLLGAYASLEGFGIGLLLPVLQYLETGGSELSKGGVWSYLTSVSDSLGIPLNLATLLGLAFTPILLRQGVYYLNTWYSAMVQSRATQRLMVRGFRAVAMADMSFIEAQDQGALIGVVAGETGRCGQALVQYLRLLGAATIIVVYTFLLMLLSWQLAAIAIAAMGMVSVAVRSVLVASRAHGTDVTTTAIAVSSFVREQFASLRLVKMRAREEAESEEIRRLAESLRRATTKIAVASARIEVIVDPALMFSVFVIIYIGVTKFGLTLSSLGLFMFILLRLNAKAKEVNLGRQALASTMPSFDYVEATFAQAEQAESPGGGSRVFPGLTSGLLFDDVTFSYEAAEGKVLDGVSLDIPKGTMVAIVGRSGAGKSTLVDMIPRLRHPDSGAISVDGVPIEEFDVGSLRKRIGFLTQEPILFNDTIYHNLVYGLDVVPTLRQVEAALDAGYCREFVSALPEGLETRLGDRGVRFSGGQRQRITLARVLLQDPDILILDEPTSALDSESEQYIKKALEALHGRTTLVVIAHRLATVENADQIVVLSEGRVAEVGTHSDLILNRDSVYHRLFDMQIHA